MTKHEELVWRLGKLPTVEEITTLIDKKIITQDEARQILFNTKSVDERDKKSLEDEIKFLRELVEKLSKDRNQIITVLETVKTPYYYYDWYKPYGYWSGTVYCGTANTISGTGNILTNLTGSCTTTASSQNCAFSNIQTF